MDIEAIRAIERIVIVIFAGTSIVLGWHLFKIGVVSPQSGTLSGKGFKVSLQKVGPGIFFSLYGSVILSVALIYGLTKEKVTIKTDNNQEKIITRMSLNNSLQDSEIKRITEAINTLDLVNIDTSSSYKKHREALNAAIERLKAFRDRLTRQKFKNNKLSSYQTCLKSNDPACKQDKSFKEIEKWLSDTLL
jgi:hypothetical protein|tara:strand:- start:726 stop:1298 length:573 start_codon:yes stop_codon:yes gene_type:complete